VRGRVDHHAVTNLSSNMGLHLAPFAWRHFPFSRDLAHYARARKAVNIPSRHQYNAKGYSAASATARCHQARSDILEGMDVPLRGAGAQF
jgi:hypothetical protein